MEPFICQNISIKPVILLHMLKQINEQLELIYSGYPGKVDKMIKENWVRGQK